MNGERRLLLLHGLGMSARVWEPVRPRLQARHDVAVLTMLGHRGGAPARSRPAVVGELVDDVERTLDARRIDQLHVAGNSLGGWVAIELARRGRALSVCALSPAGSWHAGTSEQTHGVRKIERARRAAQRTPRFVRSIATHAPFVRRWIFRDVATHGNRLTSTDAIEAMDDLLQCDVLDDFLSTPEELLPLDPLPCPVTLAWSGNDEILPIALNGDVARTRFPSARFVVLPGIGHVPMIDDPQGVASVILETTDLASGPRRAGSA